MLAILLPGLLSLQQDERGPCQLHPNVHHPVVLNFHQMTKASITSSTGIWVPFGTGSASSTVRLVLCACRKIYQVTWVVPELSGIVQSSPQLPPDHGKVSQVSHQGCWQLVSHMASWPREGILLRVYLRCFPYTPCDWILTTNLRGKPFVHWWQMKSKS